MNQALGGRTSIRFFKNLDLGYPRQLEPERYVLEFTPVTAELGQGAKRAVDLLVPEPPKPPDPPINLPRVIVIVAILAAILVIFLLKMRTKGLGRA